MNQTWENSKKSSFGPDFGPFGRNLDLIFFFKTLAVSVTTCYGQLLPCAISKKTNHPILRNPSDERTDGQTDESYFIGHCPTKVERPIKTIFSLF